MADANVLLMKHRSKGVLLDANLWVLYLVGSVNAARISRFDRTHDYTLAEFALLTRLLDWFGGIAATPHVLSQVSDLATPGQPETRLVRQRFKTLLQRAEEHYETSRLLAGHAQFERLGLADAAIATAADQGRLVLTDDLDLQIAIEKCGGDALDFRHLRDMEMEGLWPQPTR